MITRNLIRTAARWLGRRAADLLGLIRMPVYFGRCPAWVGRPVWVILPFSQTTFHCGLAGLISIVRPAGLSADIDLPTATDLLNRIRLDSLDHCLRGGLSPAEHYLGGDRPLDRLLTWSRALKQQDSFVRLFANPAEQAGLAEFWEQLTAFIQQETHAFQNELGRLDIHAGDIADRRIETLKDTAWSLKVELLDNMEKVRRLMGDGHDSRCAAEVGIYRNLNTVLNSIDRLEVRGRDSAGVSLLFILEPQTYAAFEQAVREGGLTDQIKQRSDHHVLDNGAISIHKDTITGLAGISLTFKVAAEIGSLGDNVAAVRNSIAGDAVLHTLTCHPHRFHTVSAHTRWASVGAINIANCHPEDNAVPSRSCSTNGIIHACLNGDIDNYIQLKEQWEIDHPPAAEEITTDTKIIPLHIDAYLQRGLSVEEAFRSAVNDFHGSHAIAMHTDLAPGKFFLAQKGSGQAVFVGLAADHYLPTSEVYGFVEETQRYLKLNGERVIQGNNGPVQGQIYILDQTGSAGLQGIRAMYYDGTPIPLTEDSIHTTAITSRDIDRQTFSHYFLKEISEAPLSVAKTLQNRWKVDKNDPDCQTIVLDESAFPRAVSDDLAGEQIRRIFFIGQGTAAIAAQAGADILSYYLNDPALKISAMKASELSGFRLESQQGEQALADTLVIAISQSGTTTDTNRAVDMVRSRGARTLAVVNRRDSDLTFKVQGVVYTSSGRDIEMSVASTKAFYSQIVACALLSLKIAQIRKRRSASFITDEIKALIALPDQMRKVLAGKEHIQKIAARYAPTKTYWAVVGSGPNKTAADEIRIKLSELCYKTISSDYVEDKKHIDLSSEPLIIVCAAGTGGTVIGDIIKDTAIFNAHKALPVVIADEDETRFEAHAAAVIHVPEVRPHLAPIVNTLAGHLWGYYAALAINDGSLFLHRFREDLQQSVNQYGREGLDVYEVVLEKGFREKIAAFYTDFRQRLTTARLPTTIRYSADLLLLLKYLAGRLPVSDFELDFNKKGTPLNMLNSLFSFLGEAINDLSRPVDAIKHQAKTVTVGTSRISTKIEGILFEALTTHDINASQLTTPNIMVLKNLQHIVAAIHGSILYKIDGLDLLGELTEHTEIRILRKEGILASIPSRVEHDYALKGTKRIVVRQGNVYIGKGRKDDRSILLIPALAIGANRIEFLLLLNIDFRDPIVLEAKIKALGGKYEHIKNIVQENSIAWQDNFLDQVPMDELFGRSAEKVGEHIVSLTGK